MPQCIVIPVIAYRDVGEAIDWLCDVFGFTVRLRIGGHRAQLNVGDGAVVLTGGMGEGAESLDSVMVRVDDVDGHHERAKRRGRG
ncbi:MAG TPA: VOC family protein [Edaphobacter sp.]|nr:VOC family protein [Edaphobacter sp.]